MNHRDASAIAVAVMAMILTAAAWTFDGGGHQSGGFDPWLARLTGPGAQVAETDR